MRCPARHICYFVGIVIASLRGSNTGVFVGYGYSEAQECLTNHVDDMTGYELSGSLSNLSANRISYFFDLKGE